MNTKLKKVIFISVLVVCGLVAYNYVHTNEKHVAVKVDTPSKIKASSKLIPQESIKNALLIEQENIAKKTEEFENAFIKDELEVVIDVPDHDKRIVIEYGEELPPIPDPEYVKENFVDFNSNGVRDDIEIEIVEEFGDDQDVVEMFFADARTQEFAIYLVKNHLLDNEHLQKVMDNTEYLVKCSVTLYRDSEFYSETNNWLVAHHRVFDGYHNSYERKQAKELIKKSLFGYSKVETNEETCKEFYDETKEWQLI